MNRFQKLLTPRVTLALFALSVLLLLISTVGGARAALTYFSQSYTSRVRISDIGVTLVENGADVAWRNYDSSGDGSWNQAGGELLAPLRKELEEKGEYIKLGVTYPEALSVRNSGSINQYVRVTLYKYWTDAEGNKLQEFSPDLIGLRLVNLDGAWTRDSASETAERTVLYYNGVLEAGESTVPFTDTLTIDSLLGSKVRQEISGNTVTTVFAYDGVSFQIEAVVDAVQEHNAADAMRSAWGTARPAA